MSSKFNILIPGSFKPVHSGHIHMIKNYLLNPERDTNVYLFISDKERDGVSIETTIDFLNKIFSGEKNLKIIPCHGSPIKAIYNSTSTKEFG